MFGMLNKTMLENLVSHNITLVILTIQMPHNYIICQCEKDYRGLNVGGAICQTWPETRQK